MTGTVIGMFPEQKFFATIVHMVYKTCEAYIVGWKSEISRLHCGGKFVHTKVVLSQVILRIVFGLCVVESL